MDAKEYKERVESSKSLPEFDHYFPFLGTNNNGELIMPTEEDMKKLLPFEEEQQRFFGQ